MGYIRVPSLAENVDVATIAKWLVSEGECVEAGQGVAEMLTEKADFILESDISGTVTHLFFPEKSVVPVGAVLLGIDCDAEAVEKALRENKLKIDTHADFVISSEGTSQKDKAVFKQPSSKVRATPAARRLAKEHGIDLGMLSEKTGGLVREEHVRAEMDS